MAETEEKDPTIWIWIIVVGIAVVLVVSLLVFLK
jgi:hypothetical protein